MSVGDAALSQGDVMRRLRDLERQMRELQAGRRLQAATIGAGGIAIRGGSLRTLDDLGRLVAQVGELPDGTHGVAAVDPATDELVSLATLAFGVRADREGGATSVTSTSYAPPGDAAGPEVTVQVGTSTRMLVFVSARISITDDGGFPTATGYMGFQVDGPGGYSATPGDAAAATWTGAESTGAVSTVATLLGPGGPLELPEAGAYTLSARYRVNGGEASVQSRTLIALPY
ncbi:hypothetical protein ACFHW1_04900 [Micromonospora sp. LOL_014]|uniref:hypothetical protein n=1 Tax=Micromonospora sp. LOL_014 TaxID=3345415 RepID=UPI003A854426